MDYRDDILAQITLENRQLKVQNAGLIFHVKCSVAINIILAASIVIKIIVVGR